MKYLVLLLSVFSLVACSSGKDDKKDGGGAGPRTEFEKIANGTWVSDCQNDRPEGPYRDMLVLAPGGKGSTTILVYQSQNCAEENATAQPTTAFTYKEGPLEGNARKIIMTIPNVGEKTVTVQIAGSEMTVISDEKQVRYQKSQPVGGTPGNGGASTAAFEAVAVGTWVSETCYSKSLDNGQPVTVFKVITLKAGGKGTDFLNVYKSQDCSGDPLGTGNLKEFTYQVDKFEKGNGQITVTVDGKVTKTTVVIAQNSMSVTGDQGTEKYIKAQ